jgi:radical SAM-linked protein
MLFSKSEPSVVATIRSRVRIRFRKTGDLRLISHRDLVRALERILRRAGLQMSMSEGFHPKPRMSFPAALGLGMTGLEELVEIELAEELPGEAVYAALAPQCPAGLELLSVETMPPGTRKARVHRLRFEMALPADRHEVVATRIAAFWQGSEGNDSDSAVDVVALRPSIESLALVDDRLSFTLLVNEQGGARPRAVLDVLGLGDLEGQGVFLTRTAVELEP